MPRQGRCPHNASAASERGEARRFAFIRQGTESRVPQPCRPVGALNFEARILAVGYWHVVPGRTKTSRVIVLVWVTPSTL